MGGIEHVEAALGEISGAHLVAEFAPAGLDRHDPGEDFEQGGFARTIGTDQRETLAALRGKRQSLVDDAVPIGLRDIGESHHPPATAGRLRKSEMQAGHFLLRRFDRCGQNVGDLLFLRLGARGEGVLGAEAVDETLQVGDLPLLVLPGRLPLDLGGLALAEKGVVIPVPPPEALLP